MKQYLNEERQSTADTTGTTRVRTGTTGNRSATSQAEAADTSTEHRNRCWEPRLPFVKQWTNLAAQSGINAQAVSRVGTSELGIAFGWSAGT